MRRSVSRSVILALVAAAAGWLVALSTATMSLADDRRHSRDESLHANARAMIQEGLRTFRFDTFGDEAFWGERFGCTRPSPAPSSAVSARASAHGPRSAVGLKVDLDGSLPDSCARSAAAT